jgi:2,4-dienoyl-CoA reductase-like NADH-dependent reductase (Old Yellow Enzyme family)/NADPH-dependent 2,4-dienoyl-CoA reductase/sulfur reductase-like enzyme
MARCYDDVGVRRGDRDRASIEPVGRARIERHGVGSLVSVVAGATARTVNAAAFPHLARPLRLRHRTLRNRVTFGAHTANMSEGGLPGDRHRAYYQERARGGAAMIVVEPVPVHATGVLTRGNFRHADDSIIPGFRRITDAIHEEGATIIHQLYHVGQHGDFDNSFRESWSPSGRPSYHDSDGSHAMTEREIEELIDGFVGAARRAQRCGFDGVEIFAAYNAVVDQFWLPWSNRRTDRWGGSFENRMRFSSELLRRIRAVVGDDFIVGLATSVDPTVDVALQTDELCEIVAWHDERELMDYVTCGTGSYFNFGILMPTFQFADKLGVSMAEALKGAVTHAKVQAESHIRTPENADDVIAAGQADLVSIVRGQIADPYLVRKALAGRPDDVRRCISCNQMCWGRRSRDYWISCLVNPSAGREFEWGGDTFEPAADPRAVLVVGGGPAGLETARVAAERGHAVTLAEAGPALGGAFRLAGLQPRRSQITELIGWYERQLGRLGVRVMLNSPLDGEEARSFGVDRIVVATGSQPAGTGFQRFLPAQDVLPGVDRPDACSIDDVLSHNIRPGDRVVVLDDVGDWRGAGTAWHLAERGHRVTIVSSWPLIGYWIQRTAGDLELRARLARLGVDWQTEAVVTSWGDDGATVRSHLDGRERVIAADTLVLATTNVSETTVADELAELGVDGVRVVGDALAARLAVHAIHDGRVAGMSI